MSIGQIRWRHVLVVLSGGFLGFLGALLIYGLAMPSQWFTGVYAGGWVGQGANRQVVLAPFGPLTQADVFTINVQPAGSHFYLLGSDPGGRDLLGLVAHGAVPSLELVAVVVAARLILGAIAGLAMGFGSTFAARVADSIGSWIIGFPYLALAIVVIQSLEPNGKLLAFVVGMSVVGWRDVALQVAERIEHVRSQSFAEAARALGTGRLAFFRLHVLPFLRPVLTVEVPFQASAALVLLAELGYLQIFFGQVIRLTQANDNSLPLLVSPELGQMLANTRRYLLYHEMAPVLVPALAIAALALGFELLGTAMRGRWRFGR